jgi:hypothetical protein
MNDQEIIDKFIEIIGEDYNDLDVSRAIDRISNMLKVPSNQVYDIVKTSGHEAFVEDEHPRDNDGKFAKKDGGGSDQI